MHAAFQKMTRFYLKIVFRSSAHRIPEEFTSTVLSTDAALSRLGQGVSCFYPQIKIGGWLTIPKIFLFGQLLDGLIACGWDKKIKHRGL